MRSRILLLVLAGTALCTAGCAHTPDAPGTPQAFIFACDKPNAGQYIAVQGYLRLPSSLDSGSSVMLRLYPDPSYMGTPIGVQMPFGDGPNQVHRINRSYRDNDLKVHLADGKVVSFRARVRVSGRMFFPALREDYPCALQDPYVEPGN
jgi:hypothetical protein